MEKIAKSRRSQKDKIAEKPARCKRNRLMTLIRIKERKRCLLFFMRCRLGLPQAAVEIKTFQ
ncbi:MAG: hypothetical protein P8X68_11730 [Desulfobacterales bacterium]